MPIPQKLYVAIASKIAAKRNCAKSGNVDWQWKHHTAAERLCQDHMPSGSGFDAGTNIDWDKSTHERLVFTTAFHHMDEHGSYDGWTEHVVTVKSSLLYGFTLKISGKDRNAIKEYMWECFETALAREIVE